MSIVISAPTETGFGVVQAVAGFAPHFRERRAITDADRRVPVASMDELREAGMLRMLVPKVFGGLELTIGDFVDATVAAARGCPSTGWCAGQMAFAALVFASGPVEAQRAIWGATPNVRSASTATGITATPAPGGFLLSGKAPFASGIDHAQWLYLGAPIIQDGKMRELRFFFLRKDQVSVLDTWDTSAMRGTGSNTVVVDNAFVQDAFSVRHDDLREGRGPGSAFNTNPMYSLPWVAVVPLIYVSTMLGATQAAFEEMVESLKTKRTPGGQNSADSEELQLEVSFVAAKIAAPTCSCTPWLLGPTAAGHTRSSSEQRPCVTPAISRCNSSKQSTQSWPSVGRRGSSKPASSNKPGVTSISRRRTSR